MRTAKANVGTYFSQMYQVSFSQSTVHIISKEENWFQKIRGKKYVQTVNS